VIFWPFGSLFETSFLVTLLRTMYVFFRRRVCFRSSGLQGCQMVNFQTKNPNLGKFWMVLQ
jgi:hypothetical protein